MGQAAIDIEFDLLTKRLEKRMVELPFEFVRRAADKSVGEAAYWVLAHLENAAPVGESGITVHSLEISKTKGSRTPSKKGRRLGILAKRMITVNKRLFDDYYYALPIEFGWDDKPTGYPWFVQAVADSATFAFGVFRARMARELLKKEIAKDGS